MLAIDGTYKISSENFPMLILATLNRNHNNFPIAYAISSNETE